MGAPRYDGDEWSATLLHCFLAEGTCGGVGLLATLSALEQLAEPTARGANEPAGQQWPTPSRTVSS